MKKLHVGLLFSTLLFFMMALASCGNNSAPAEAEQGKEYTSAYICPMHCEGSGSDQAGKCPVCKMDYVANADAKPATKEHNHSHDGHDHSGHDHSH